ncbi:unnamed protein product [Boreogadus saida]
MLEQCSEHVDSAQEDDLRNRTVKGSPAGWRWEGGDGRAGDGRAGDGRPGDGRAEMGGLEMGGLEMGGLEMGGLEMGAVRQRTPALRRRLFMTPPSAQRSLQPAVYILRPTDAGRARCTRSQVEVVQVEVV